jgi:BirA family transcriptional regulator, biotin operon repressor / biotin---[acetyl-CoA-carboxylase] ligase
LATPYFQLRLERVPSTQDVARENLEDLPLLVLASSQSRGRGRSGAKWLTADRALAASLAFHHDASEDRPLSLMAGLAAVRATSNTALKWPNDVMVAEAKVGGILVERSEDTTVIGLGLNLWWADPPEGMGGLLTDDPGEERFGEVGALWGAELMELLDETGWPIDAYREASFTLGRQITWDPDGEGHAIDISSDGALVVETRSGIEKIYAGAVRHVR